MEATRLPRHRHLFHFTFEETMSPLVCITLALGALCGTASPPAKPAPLIPRKVLFGNPVKAAPNISPDGKRLAWLAPDKNNVLQLWVRTLGKDDARQITADKKRGILNYSWTYRAD